MLRIGERWVTSHHQQEIHRARHEPALRAYCLEKFKKYNWDDDVFDLVSWSSVGSVRRKYGQTKRMFTSKTMYGWLPIGHMRHHITKVNQCPGCRHDDETMEHLFRCTHRSCVTTRTKALKELASQGRKKKVPRHIMEAVCHVIRSECAGKKAPLKLTHTPAIKHAIRQQHRISSHLMLRGFLAAEWCTAMQDSGVKEPELRMISLQRLIWDEWVTPIWRNRNELMHKQVNRHQAAEDRGLNERILWYVEHRHELLSHHDQFLASIDLSRLDGMRRKTKKKWLTHLDKAEAAYRIELKARKKGQHTMWSYLGMADPSKEGVT